MSDVGNKDVYDSGFVVITGSFKSWYDVDHIFYFITII